MAKRPWYNPEPTYVPAPEPEPPPPPPKVVGPRRRSRGRTPSGKANPIDTYVGGRVRLRRTLLGMSQEELGAALCLTFQQVQKYERGANRIGASRLYDLSRALGVTVSYFFDAIPNEVAAAAPSAMRHAEVDPDIPDANNIMASRETLELTRYIDKLSDRDREAVEGTIRALSGLKG